VSKDTKLTEYIQIGFHLLCSVQLTTYSNRWKKKTDNYSTFYNQSIY